MMNLFLGIDPDSDAEVKVISTDPDNNTMVVDGGEWDSGTDWDQSAEWPPIFNQIGLWQHGR